MVEERTETAPGLSGSFTSVGLLSQGDESGRSDGDGEWWGRGCKGTGG